jgi:hypothetical protein
MFRHRWSFHLVKLNGGAVLLHPCLDGPTCLTRIHLMARSAGYFVNSLRLRFIFIFHVSNYIFDFLLWPEYCFHIALAIAIRLSQKFTSSVDHRLQKF